jgi:hypothetical protein
VSTILKALEELEQRSPAAKPNAASSKYEHVSRAWSVTPLLVMLTAGSLVGMVYFAVRGGPKSVLPAKPQRVSEPTTADSRPPGARAVVEAVAPAPATRAAVAVAPASAPAAPSTAREPVAAEEAPWGRVEKGSAIVPDAATIASAAAPRAPSARAFAEAPAPSAARAIAEPPTVPPSRAEEPVRREVAMRPSRRESPAAPVDRTPPSATSGGGSGAEVEVMSIAYSANVSARSAALRIGGQAMTLHQGDSARGVEVQLILPNSVYLRRGRDIFAVDARR